MQGIRIKTKNYIFKPALIPSLITIALLYLMISLGLWQIDRAEYKANLQSIIESKKNTQAIPLNLIKNTATEENQNEWLYQPVYIEGSYDLSHQIYFDNQINNTVAGYSVYTPLKLSSNTAILINRGWVPLGINRINLPDISINNSNKSIKLTGLLTPPPSKTLVLSDNANSYLKWPAVLQYIDITEIEKHLDYQLLPVTIIMNNQSQTSLEILPVKINMRSEKHTAYAFQWFALSLAVLIIYIVVNTKRTVKN